MKRQRLAAAALVACGLWLAGCGYSDWPPEDINRPSARAPGSAAFIGADAVRVGRGDTVYGLSRRHRVSARAIIEANGLRPPYHLRIGQRIVLPRRRDYVVRRGDTLFGIAGRTGAGAYAIARLNGLKPPYTIRVGQRLALPGAGTLQTVAVSRKAGSAGASSPTPPKKPAAGKSKPPPTTAPRPPSAVPKPPPVTGKGFLWPVKGRVVSGFGAKAKGLRNDGINIAAKRGAPVRATENGIVAYAGNELRGFGNLLLIKHAGGWVSAYAHNDKLLVKRGQRIKKGQNIATVGSTGNVRKPQLHFELRKGRTARDPRKYLRRPT